MTNATRNGSHNHINLVRGCYTRQWAMAICVGPEVGEEGAEWWYYGVRFASRDEAQAAKYALLDRFAGKGALSISRHVVQSPDWDRELVV